MLNCVNPSFLQKVWGRDTWSWMICPVIHIEKGTRTTDPVIVCRGRLMFDCPLVACLLFVSRIHVVWRTNVHTPKIHTGAHPQQPLHLPVIFCKPNDSWPVQVSGKVLLHKTLAVVYLYFMYKHNFKPHFSHTTRDPRPRSLYCIK